MNKYIIIIFLSISYSIHASDAEIKALIKKGILHQKNNECAHAIKDFKEVIKRKPQMYKLYNRIAFCFDYLGFEKVSIKYYKRTLDFDPQDPYALKTLRRIYSNKKEAESIKNTKEILIPKQNDGLTNLINYSVKMFYNLNGVLYHSDRDGAYKRKFAEFSLGKIYPSNSKLGVATIIEEGLNYQKLHFFDFHKSEFFPVAEKELSVVTPFYSDTRNKIVFLSTSKDGKSKKLMQVDAKMDVDPKTLVEDFYSIDEFVMNEESQNIYFVGRKESGLKSRIYKLSSQKEIVQLSFVGGDFSNIKVLSNDKFLLSRQKNDRQKYNLLVIDLTNKLISNITHEGFDELTGVWGNTDKSIYYTASNISLTEKWKTKLVKYEREAGFATTLSKSAFLQEDLYVDELEKYVYARSNYDSNYEIYRFRISSPKRERLTITDEDEEHLRFMTVYKKP
ncbi:MAG: hypothetical protein KC646_15220 [Candidatus Cloacimonetes bacterium]|nr:hypothetical protein [Candidatus Cloacimonadota bacterium]